MKRPFGDITVGSYLHDMHDTPMFGNGLNIIEEHQITSLAEFDSGAGSAFIQATLAHWGITEQYVNKMLVVIAPPCDDVQYEGGRRRGAVLTAVYSYDDRKFGLAKIFVELLP